MNFLLFLFFCGSAKALIEVKNFTVNSELKNAISAIIEDLIVKFDTINFIYAVRDLKDERFMDVSQELLVNCKPNHFVRIDEGSKISTIAKRIKKNSIFILDTLTSFDMLKTHLIPSKFDFNGHFLFILSNGLINDIQQIFTYMWSKQIYNVDIIYEANSEIILTTFLPFENPKSCGNTNPKIINKFKAGKFENDEIFPSKVKNFNGCPLRVVTFEDEDAVMRTNTGDLHGYLAELLQTLAQKLNFTPQINFLTENFAYGVVFPNGTATGSLGELYKNKSDFALGDFFLKANRIEYFEFSRTFQVMDLVWIIPPGRLYLPLEKLLQPFHEFVWILIAVILLIAILVIFIINYRFKKYKSFVYGTNVHHPHINLLIAIFGAQQSPLPKRNFARFILMMFLIFCLVLRNTYQGALYQFLQSEGRHKEVESIDEMIKNDFTFYAFETSVFDLIQGSNAEIFKRLKSFDEKNFLLSRELDGSEKIAGLEVMKNVISANRGNFTIFYCKEPFMYLNIVFYFRKNSYLRKSFNAKIDQALTGGIIQQYITKYSSKKKKIQEKKLKKLNFWQLSGAFYLLLFGLLFACFTFIGELATSQKTFKCF